MKTTIKHAIAFLFVFLIYAQANAAAPKWELDPAHSGIYFSVKHIYSTVRGHFEDFKGTVMFSPDDLANSRFDFEVDVKSINTRHTKRDSDLNSANFFDSKKYPTMTFKSSAVKHVKDNQYVVDGELTVKDVSKSVSVPFTFMGIKDFPFDKKSEVAGFEASLTIDRLAYNVGSGKFYDMGTVGNEVDVLITMEVLRKK